MILCVLLGEQVAFPSQAMEDDILPLKNAAGQVSATSTETHSSTEEDELSSGSSAEDQSFDERITSFLTKLEELSTESDDSVLSLLQEIFLKDLEKATWKLACRAWDAYRDRPQNTPGARAIMRLAAIGGYTHAQYEYGGWLQQGIGGPKNPEEGLKWHLEALKNGYEEE